MRNLIAHDVVFRYATHFEDIFARLRTGFGACSCARTSPGICACDGSRFLSGISLYPHPAGTGICSRIRLRTDFSCRIEKIVHPALV